MARMLQTKLGPTVLLVLLMATLSGWCVEDSQWILRESGAISPSTRQQTTPQQVADDLDLGWLEEYKTGHSARDSSGEPASSSQAVAPYRQPSKWIINILKEFFDDIDWATIEDASRQIEKFIGKVDRLIGSVRSVISKATAGSSSTLTGGGGGQSPWSATGQRAATGQGRWWWGSKASTPAGVELGADLSSVKGMLERVACFVGYVRLMNLSNEALAELDAAKVVSNLFSSVNKRNSSGWGWFG